MGSRQVTRLVAALAITAVPIAMGPFDQIVNTSATVAPGSTAVGQGSGTVAALPAGYSGLAEKPSKVLPAQRIAPRTVIEGRLALKTAKERHRKVEIATRKGITVWTASELTDTNMPVAALHAYKHAAALMASEDPSCHIPWTLLAGIGRVESDNGQFGGSVLGSDGISRPAIIGVALNGVGPVAAVHDTDNGVYDGDKVWDHAVGPMQFLPSTWAWAGRDGDGNGVKNPQDINDAALAAAGYLCHGISGSILAPASMRAAIFHYNPSTYYVALVEAFARGYATGVFAIPSPPPPADHHKHHKNDKKHGKKHAKADKNKKKGKVKQRGAGSKPTKQSSPKPSGSGGSSSPKPSPKPSPSPTPTPSPSPSPSTDPSPSPSPSASPTSTPTPTTATVSGTLTSCGSGWCVGSTTLDLGTASKLAATAASDYDGDGKLETNTAELNGLVGHTVNLVVEASTSPAVVEKINDLAYQ